MATPKLSESDKQQIAQIYCQPGESTSTLAKKFGVSSSTVSRVLKQIFSDEDYASLAQWKRSGENGELVLSANVPVSKSETQETHTAKSVGDKEASETSTKSSAGDQEAIANSAPAEEPQTITVRRSRRRSKAKDVTDDASSEAQSAVETEETEVEAASAETAEPQTDSKKLIKKSDRAAEIPDSDVAAWVSEGLEDVDSYDDDDDDWDDEDWDDEADEGDEEILQAPREEELAILSFEEFSLKQPCYLVVDRLAELITCPLRDFAELGLIPSEEEQARTLPVFDNHKVARRFARRNQRIIKVPNGLMLNKTQDYLQAKGITRVLFDGRVYALN